MPLKSPMLSSGLKFSVATSTRTSRISIAVNGTTSQSQNLLAVYAAFRREIEFLEIHGTPPFLHHSPSGKYDSRKLGAQVSGLCGQMQGSLMVGMLHRICLIAGIVSTLMFMTPAVARDYGVQKHHGQRY